MPAPPADVLLATLEDRFRQNMHRHTGLDWDVVRVRIKAKRQAIRSLAEMERTGGEPDVVGLEPGSGAVIFTDCSPESPEGRRSLRYDPAALAARKANKPAGSAIGMADDMGVSLLTEDQYRALQALGEFDRKTSSWVLTPAPIRGLGGALFCDRRYGAVFVYHNGVESYYGARGFRGRLVV